MFAQSGELSKRSMMPGIATGERAFGYLYDAIPSGAVGTNLIDLRRELREGR